MIQDEKYYQLAKEASSQIGSHPGLLKIKRLVSESKNVLDVGCGEGTRLNLFVKKGNHGTGVDVSAYAVSTAKKQYPNHKFICTQDEKLPFSSGSFDLIYSTFVLEHTNNQKVFVEEMIRVVKKNGIVIILCPNYGAPNRRSPVSHENPVIKLVRGFFCDTFSLLKDLEFTQVIPKKNFKEIDDDTTCEPYLHVLIKYLERNHNINLMDTSSLWEIDDNAKTIHQKLFKFLGQKNIFPFKYWGPQLFLIIKKK